MGILRVGVMGCSSFAQRAMIPALVESNKTELVAVASRTLEKAREFAASFHCEAIGSYEELLSREDIDAVYMPLPTGLHDEWVTKTIEAGKHILVEKSFAATLSSAEDMVALAREKNILLMENYLFPHHSQTKWIRDVMDSGELGDVHLVRSTFGFPPLPEDNFRYNKDLGGGALLDAGGYVIKVTRLLLGDDVQLLGSSLTYDDKLGVDIYGEAQFKSPRGLVSQVAFGFNYHYQCNLEILGTKGKLTAERIFTPPPGFSPKVIVEHQGSRDEQNLIPDNHYLNMFDYFADSILENKDFNEHWDSILNQAKFLEQIRNNAVR